MSTVIEASQKFVAQVMTTEVRGIVTDYAKQAVKNEGSLRKLSDLFHQKGGRVAHVRAVEGETPEDKSTRLEMVRVWDEAFISGMNPTHKAVLAMDKKTAKTATDKQKEDRHTAQRILSVYRGRFVAYLDKLENPNGKPEKEKTEKEKTEATGEKSPEQFILEDLVSLRGHAMKCPEGELIDAILTFTAQSIMALGGSIE